nr:MAG TPA: hypothetical protein [Caudoviricetes sp.]
MKFDLSTVSPAILTILRTLGSLKKLICSY